MWKSEDFGKGGKVMTWNYRLVRNREWSDFDNKYEYFIKICEVYYNEDHTIRGMTHACSSFPEAEWSAVLEDISKYPILNDWEIDFVSYCDKCEKNRADKSYEGPDHKTTFDLRFYCEECRKCEECGCPHIYVDGYFKVCNDCGHKEQILFPIEGLLEESRKLND